MNRLLRLFLLVSLGLNLGLGWVVWRDRPVDGPDPKPSGRAWRERPAPDDSVGWHRMMEHRVERLAARLDLTPEQAGRLQRMQLLHGPQVQAQRARLEAARGRLRTVGDAGSYDPEAIRAALAGMRREQAGLDSLTQGFLLEELDLMTATQRARYLELLPLDPGRGGGRRHRRQ